MAAVELRQPLLARLAGGAEAIHADLELAHALGIGGFAAQRLDGGGLGGEGGFGGGNGGPGLGREGGSRLVGKEGKVDREAPFGGLQV